MEKTGDRPVWMSAESLLRADHRGEFTDLEIVAGHEAGHALVASALSTWPHVTLNPIAYSGETLRLPARNGHESIAIITAGIEADALQAIDSVRVRLSQAQDWNNLITRYPSVTRAEVDPARKMARRILLSNRDGWWRLRERLLVTNYIDWRELAVLVSGKEVELICINCEEDFDVTDPSVMGRDMDCRLICPSCVAQMSLNERLS